MPRLRAGLRSLVKGRLVGFAIERANLTILCSRQMPAPRKNWRESKPSTDPPTSLLDGLEAEKMPAISTDQGECAIPSSRSS
ncbi:hypothetical protein CLAIMM_04271 [Cladophialophora immunda]|nr:hypothetical protein CLAIMM_04271 [Cladophialophora immunda]